MSEKRAAWLSERRANLLIRLALVVPLTTAIFFLLGFSSIIPVSVSSYATAAGTDCTLCEGSVIGTVHIPGTYNVTLTWADTTGGKVGVKMTGPGGVDGPAIPQCAAVGSNGTCTFTSVQGNYSLQALGGEPGEGQVVTFTATWYVALL